MKNLVSSVLLLLLAGISPGFAAEPTVNDKSIRELLEITGVQEMLDGVPAQVDELIQAALEATLEGQEMSSSQRQLVDELRTKTATLFNEAITGPKLRSDLIQAFAGSFTLAEVDALLGFYRTEVGRSLVKKLPLVRRAAEQALEARLTELEPMIDALVTETIDKLR